MATTRLTRNWLCLVMKKIKVVTLRFRLTEAEYERLGRSPRRMSAR